MKILNKGDVLGSTHLEMNITRTNAVSNVNLRSHNTKVHEMANVMLRSKLDTHVDLLAKAFQVDETKSMIQT